MITDDLVYPLDWYPGRSLKDVEKEVIETAFVHTKGNKRAVAKLLGISINKVRYVLNGCDHLKKWKKAATNDCAE